MKFNTVTSLVVSTFFLTTPGWSQGEISDAWNWKSVPEPGHQRKKWRGEMQERMSVRAKTRYFLYRQAESLFAPHVRKAPENSWKRAAANGVCDFLEARASKAQFMSDLFEGFGEEGIQLSEQSKTMSNGKPVPESGHYHALTQQIAVLDAEIAQLQGEINNQPEAEAKLKLAVEELCKWCADGEQKKERMTAQTEEHRAELDKADGEIKETAEELLHVAAAIKGIKQAARETEKSYKLLRESRLAEKAEIEAKLEQIRAVIAHYTEEQDSVEVEETVPVAIDDQEEKGQLAEPEPEALVEQQEDLEEAKAQEDSAEKLETDAPAIEEDIVPEVEPVVAEAKDDEPSTQEEKAQPAEPEAEAPIEQQEGLVEAEALEDSAEKLETDAPALEESSVPEVEQVAAEVEGDETNAQPAEPEAEVQDDSPGKPVLEAAAKLQALEEEKTLLEQLSIVSANIEKEAQEIAQDKQKVVDAIETESLKKQVLKENSVALEKKKSELQAMHDQSQEALLEFEKHLSEQQDALDKAQAALQSFYEVMPTKVQQLKEAKSKRVDLQMSADRYALSKYTSYACLLSCVTQPDLADQAGQWDSPFHPHDRLFVEGLARQSKKDLLTSIQGAVDDKNFMADVFRGYYVKKGDEQYGYHNKAIVAEIKDTVSAVIKSSDQGKKQEVCKAKIDEELRKVRLDFDLEGRAKKWKARVSTAPGSLVDMLGLKASIFNEYVPDEIYRELLSEEYVRTHIEGYATSIPEDWDQAKKEIESSYFSRLLGSDEKVKGCVEPIYSFVCRSRDAAPATALEGDQGSWDQVFSLLGYLGMCYILDHEEVGIEDDESHVRKQMGAKAKWLIDSLREKEDFLDASGLKPWLFHAWNKGGFPGKGKEDA